MRQAIEPHEHDRFWSKVEKTSGCWEWRGGRKPEGYGVFSTGGRAGGMVRAHRAAYWLLVGPIPEGLFLDHLCRNPGCVNPAHLEPVTHAENVARGDAGQHQARKTHCKHGHEFTPANTIWRGHLRQCRACNNERNRRQRAKQRLATAGV